MTFIKVDTNFKAFDTNPKNGKLDKEEVATAHAKGCIWAKEGQTETEYIQAKKEYDLAKKDESWEKLSQNKNLTLDSVFSTFKNNQTTNKIL